jgi:IS5 family transposase
MEEAIYDRFSFQSFLGVDRIESTIPDETTILQFRHLLEEHQLTAKIFETINQHLAQKGLLVKAGTIVDATIITSSGSTKNEEKKRDPEMNSTKKNGQYYFGMKVHTGADVTSGLVHSVEVTPAKTSDIEMVPLLLHGEERSIHGDRGYSSDRDKFFAREAEVFWGISDKRKPHQKLSKRQRKRNQRFSSVRAKVEFTYNIIKNLWGHRRTRYRGLHKNRSQWFMLLSLSNLYMVRKKLMAIA